MKRIVALFLFGAVISLVFSSSCSNGDSTGQAKKNIVERKIATKKGDVPVGKKIYNKYCHYCHGMEGRGNGAIAIGLTPRPVDFVNDVERMRKSDEALFKSIARGIRKRDGGEEMAMPQWDLTLTEDEIWSVLAYVRHLSEKGDKKRLNDH